MRAWVNARLDERMNARNDDVDGLADWFADAEVQDRHRKAMIERARRGDVEDLKLAHPDIAELIRPPPLDGQGKRHPPPRRLDAVDLAILDASAIRALWREHYGRVNRPKGDLNTPEDIAADRWDVTIEAIESRKSHPKK